MTCHSVNKAVPDMRYAFRERNHASALLSNILLKSIVADKVVIHSSWLLSILMRLKFLYLYYGPGYKPYKASAALGNGLQSL